MHVFLTPSPNFALLRLAGRASSRLALGARITLLPFVQYTPRALADPCDHFFLITSPFFVGEALSSVAARTHESALGAVCCRFVARVDDHAVTPACACSGGSRPFG